MRLIKIFTKEKYTFSYILHSGRQFFTKIHIRRFLVSVERKKIYGKDSGYINEKSNLQVEQ